MAMNDTQKQRNEIDRIKSIIKEQLSWSSSTDPNLLSTALNEIATEFALTKKL
jgi:hypothetical protein